MPDLFKKIAEASVKLEVARKAHAKATAELAVCERVFSVLKAEQEAREQRKLQNNTHTQKKDPHTKAHHRGDPKIGSIWLRAASLDLNTSIFTPAETRHVLDRNFGGDVFFVSGRMSRFAYRQRCSYEQWSEWAKHAKKKPTK